MKLTLPETGFIRLPQLIGQKEVTTEQAQANKEKARLVREQYPVTASSPHLKKQQEMTLAKMLARIGPRTPRPAIPGIIPWSKSKLWDAIKKGEFPAPTKLSARTTGWEVTSVRQKIMELAGEK
ncbi:helix-turn-helix transcriptional regulator [Geobacter sulfurreducens]|uniref:helix-turn-helix transcriptional regulator n=1 Tax=Geobacter sulfurreducens TaxID=35554 RepID=UPI002D18EEB1|nr:AlpA family phage regulatory protein [Geobacter sulfurreducens]HML80032.1 AlpA family phage regulatory protein [Geobacter sulfurreducens]